MLESSSPALINIQHLIPEIRLDLRYATTNNFFQTKLYPSAQCFLHPKTAESLQQALSLLKPKNLSLKIFDGYRPLHIQQKMWDLILDDRYVSNPANNKD